VPSVCWWSSESAIEPIALNGAHCLRTLADVDAPLQSLLTSQAARA
jgi:hypothetical protein